MREAQRASNSEPAVSDKIHFWLGGRLPITFRAWVQKQVQSRWFPLRQMVAVVPAVVITALVNLDRDMSLSYLLLFAILPLVIWLAGVLVFRDRLRRRELRRYQMQGAGSSASPESRRIKTQTSKGEDA